MSKESARKTFAKFNRDAYADWLWRGLRSFYASPSVDKASAFDHFGLRIRQQESVCEGIARVYEDYVPESRQLMFRQAVGDVLREHGNDHDAPLSAFQDLIYLLARIRATGSLSALVSTVGTGLLGKRNPEILYETLAVLRSLAPSSYAYDAAFALVESVNFDDGYLFEAMKVLVECEPSRSSEIVLKLEPRMTQLRQSTRELGGDEWIAFCEAADDWAAHILKLGLSSWLKDFWQQSDHSPHQGWLFDLLFRNKAIPVDLLEEESVIKYRGKKIGVKLLPKDRWTRRKILRPLALREVLGWASDRMDTVNHIQILDATGIHSATAPSLIQRQKSDLIGFLVAHNAERLAPKDQ